MKHIKLSPEDADAQRAAEKEMVKRELAGATRAAFASMVEADALEQKVARLESTLATVTAERDRLRGYVEAAMSHLPRDPGFARNCLYDAIRATAPTGLDTAPAKVGEGESKLERAGEAPAGALTLFTIERLVDGVMNPLWKPVATIEAETHEEALAKFRGSDHELREWDRVRVIKTEILP